MSMMTSIYTLEVVEFHIGNMIYLGYWLAIWRSTITRFAVAGVSWEAALGGLASPCPYVCMRIMEFVGIHVGAWSVMIKKFAIGVTTHVK